MSEQQNFGFGKFVPGFDFLQNLAKGTSQPQAGMPSLSSWVAPTLNVEELDKRIGELKAVSFWLDQNAKALAATIQALELQKMTLATLRGMNFNMAELADALKLKPELAAATLTESAPASAAASAPAEAAAEKRQAGPAARKGGGKSKQAKPSGNSNGNGNGVVDPLQWWGALTQQFQEIAAGAMKEAANNPMVHASTPAAPAAKKAAPAARRPAPAKTARKSAARSR
jgi:hypothetical protein